MQRNDRQQFRSHQKERMINLHIKSKNDLFRKIRRLFTAIEHWPIFLGHSRFEIIPDLYLKLNHPWLTKAGVRTVIDIGAHTGGWARTVHHLLPQAMIYSFEPISSSFAELQKRMKGVASHKGFNIALGNESGEIDFNLNEFAAASSLLHVSKCGRTTFPEMSETRCVRVRIERLDDILMDHVLPECLIKVDVQGFEDKVIAGGIRTFSRSKFVIVETSFVSLYEGQVLFDDIHKQLASLGFSYAGNLNQTVNPNDGTICQADAIFVRGLNKGTD